MLSAVRLAVRRGFTAVSASCRISPSISAISPQTRNMSKDLFSIRDKTSTGIHIPAAPLPPLPGRIIEESRQHSEDIFKKLRKVQPFAPMEIELAQCLFCLFHGEKMPVNKDGTIKVHNHLGDVFDLRSHSLASFVTSLRMSSLVFHCPTTVSGYYGIQTVSRASNMNYELVGSMVSKDALRTLIAWRSEYQGTIGRSQAPFDSIQSGIQHYWKHRDEDVSFNTMQGYKQFMDNLYFSKEVSKQRTSDHDLIRETVNDQYYISLVKSDNALTSYNTSTAFIKSKNVLSDRSNHQVDVNDAASVAGRSTRRTVSKTRKKTAADDVPPPVEYPESSSEVWSTDTDDNLHSSRASEIASAPTSSSGVTAKTPSSNLNSASGTVRRLGQCMSFGNSGELGEARDRTASSTSNSNGSLKGMEARGILLQLQEEIEKLSQLSPRYSSLSKESNSLCKSNTTDVAHRNLEHSIMDPSHEPHAERCFGLGAPREDKKLVENAEDTENKATRVREDDIENQRP